MKTVHWRRLGGPEEASCRGGELLCSAVTADRDHVRNESSQDATHNYRIVLARARTGTRTAELKLRAAKKEAACTAVTSESAAVSQGVQWVIGF